MYPFGGAQKHGHVRAPDIHEARRDRSRFERLPDDADDHTIMGNVNDDAARGEIRDNLVFARLPVRQSGQNQAGQEAEAPSHSAFTVRRFYANSGLTAGKRIARNRARQVLIKLFAS